MTEQELQAIEERWAKWINPESAPKTLGGDFLILLAEVRRLNRELHEAKYPKCHCRHCDPDGVDAILHEQESEVADK